MKELIVAIDGPSGAGKSTLSKRLARELGYTNLDTGAMYRCVALASERAGIDAADEERLAALCENIDIRFQGERVLLNGEDVSELIRTPENSLRTSRVSACRAVREAMVKLQRELGRQGAVVLEGRDIGSAVFPEAQVKFFLSASAKERGRRRFEELRAKGVDVTLERTVAEVQERDAADSSREHAPLVQPADALPIDSTALGIEEVAQLMIRTVRNRRQELMAAGELNS